jgi:ADP-ribose pyrophosphatase YjhB (NUDIX family)
MTTAAPDATPKRHAMPFTRLEIAVMGLVDGRLQVLLGRRAEAPYPGRWALPGGVLRIDLDRSLDDAARRVLQERTGLARPFLRQLGAVGGPGRDPRAQWALSVVYRALVPTENLAPTAGKRMQALAWRPVDELGTGAALAFDHSELVGRAVEATREEVERLELPFDALPSTFTLGELQALCEQLLGRKLDKSSFRRRLADHDLVEPVEGEMRGGANRPAQVYRRRKQ